jgi:phosphatidylglycerol lysyltransferase
MPSLRKKRTAGVVLPAGSLTSQVLFSRTLTDGYKVNDSEVAAASGIYAIAGVTASVMAVVPAFGWLLSQGVLPPGSVKAFALLMAFLLLLVWLGISLVRGGRVAMFVNRRMPRVAKFLKGPDWSKFDKKHIFRAVFWALVVEVAGVAHLWVAGKALGFGMTIATAVAGYVAVLLVLMTSPFLRGVGAAEALLAFVLMRYSSDAVTAASVATLFRVFEFWGVLLVALPLLFVRSRRRSQSYNGAVTAVS